MNERQRERERVGNWVLVSSRTETSLATIFVDKHSQSVDCELVVNVMTRKDTLIHHRTTILHFMVKSSGYLDCGVFDLIG